MSNIIILFGSKYRSTSKIVGRMRAHLESKEIEVDTMTALAEPIDLTHYSLIVIGSGIYDGAPHKAVREFVRINRDALNRKKVAVFAVCGKISSKREAVKNAAQAYADVIGYGIIPVTKTVFPGRVPDLGLIRNWTKFRIDLGVKPGDYLDWNAVNRWADSLVGFAEVSS